MDIMTFLADDAVSLDLQAKNKEDALKEREELGSTGIGQGVAIPHGKSDQVKSICASFALSKDGVPFDALDGEPVHILFLLVAPDGEAAAHLKALARISSLIKDKYFRKMLRSAKNIEAVMSIIKREEKARY